jgi:trimeric autotransporter adhesin
MKTLAKLFGTLTITTVLAVQVQAQSFLTNGLVAYYPLNGNANDESGNGNNGTVFGATLTADRFGVSGMAYQFNGTNDYIAANVPNLPTGSAARTVSLWACAQPVTVGGRCLLFWGTGQNQEGFGIINNSAPYTWQGETWGGGDDVNSGVVVDTNWHQIVVIYSGSILSISVDGVQKGTLSEPIATPLSPLTIGANTNVNALQFFSGAINDVRIYNLAFSSNEVEQLYQYESTPQVAIVQAVIPSFSNLYIGTNYQLQVSPDLNTWTNSGSAFTATNSTMIYPQYFNVTNWSQFFFRLQVAQ